MGCFGQSGLQRKETPKCHRVCNFLWWFLQLFVGKKSYILMAFECFFLCSPDCPKQPITSFPFYKFFYPTISGGISECGSKKRMQDERNFLRKRLHLSLNYQSWFLPFQHFHKLMQFGFSKRLTFAYLLG